MTNYQYILKGNLYDNDTDLKTEILSIMDGYELVVSVDKNDDSFFITLDGEKKSILDFEPDLIKKITNLMEIRLYTKKEPTIQKNHQEQPIKKKNPIKKAAQLLRQEKVIALQASNGFHLICNASKPKAVQHLRELITEPIKPLNIIFKSLFKAELLLLISKKERELLESSNSIVVVKHKHLHRLEKIKYKHKLTPLINPINQRIGLSLIHDDILYDKLFDKVEFPFISVDAMTKDGKMITSKEEIVQTYGEDIEQILELDTEVSNPKQREVLQIVYGKPYTIKPKKKFINDNTVCEVCLDYEKSEIANFKLKPLKIFTQNQPKYSALSLLFSSLPIKKILELPLAFDKKEIKQLHKDWQDGINTTESTSLITLFDAMASLSDELHDKDIVEQSLMLAEEHYEVCEEGMFAYDIKDAEIDIDIVSTYLKNNKLKHLGSTLVNTISTIITEIVKEQDLDVRLSGELFNFRDLSELTIEKLEDEDIKTILI